MSVAKKKSINARRLLLTASGVVVAGWAERALAATNQYFDVNGNTSGFQTVANGSTFSWESAFWSADSTGASVPGNFIQDGSGFAEFVGLNATTNATSFTVTVGNVEPMAGIILSPASQTLNISGTGGISLSTNGASAPPGGGAAVIQSFFITSSTSSIVITASISGAGGISQHSSGAIALYGNNSFSGGFESTGGQVTDYNNNNSFGTGKIYITGTASSVQGFVNGAGTNVITIGNAIVDTTTTGINTNWVANGSGTNPGTIYSGNFALATAGTSTTGFEAASGSVAEFSGTISGNAKLSIGPNTGTIAFAGNNTFTNTITITGATLMVFADNNLGASNSVMTIGSGKLLVEGTFSNSRTINLNGTAAATIDVSAGQALTLNGTVGGTNGLIKGTNTGLLVLGKTANTYSGTTSVNGGTLGIMADGSLGSNASGTVILNAGTLLSLTNVTSGRTINLNNAAATLDATNGSTLTLNGSLIGTGALIKGTNAGIVLLNKASGATYGGVTTINGGTLMAGAVNVLTGTSAVTLKSVFDTGGFDQTIGSLAGTIPTATVTLGDLTAANLTLGGNNTSTSYTGNITGTGTGGGLFKVGNGTFTMNGTNAGTFQGDTSISGGTLSIVIDGSLGGNATANVNISTGTLLSTGTFTTTRAINFNSGTSTVDASSGKTLTLAGPIGGTGNLVKGTTAGIVLITSSNNTLAGNTTINGGILGIVDDTSLGSNASGTVTIGAGTLLALNSLSTSRTLNLSNAASTLDAASGATLTINGLVGGSGGLVKGTQAGSVLLTNSGGGTYAGATTVNGGTLAAGGTNVFATNSAFTVKSTLALNGYDQTIGSLAGTVATATVNLGDVTAANLTLGGNNTSTSFSGTFSGTGTGGSLTKVGTGTFTLNGANAGTFLGDTTVSAGTLSILQDGNLGGNATANVNIGAATLLGAGTFSSMRTVNLNDPASTLDATASNTMTLAGTVAGIGGLTKGTNAGVVYLGNAANTYAGDTTINGGTLAVVADGSLGTNTAGNVSVGTATFLADGSFSSARTLNLGSASATVDVTAGNTLVLTGTVNAAGAINKGPLTGTLQLAQNGFTATSDVNVQGGTLAFGNSVSGVTGPVSIPGALNVSDGATAAFIPSTGTAVTHTINTVNLNAAGVLDVGNSSFLTTSNVQPYLAAGYNSGGWNGTVGARIISTAAAATSNRGLGYASDADQAAGRVSNTIPTIAAGSTLVKYTVPGDADLSGSADFNDFLSLQAGFNKPGNWTQGDFDYSGTVDFNDFLVLQANFNKNLNANGTVAHSAIAHSAVSKLTAAPAVQAATVTYILSKNDDGKGNVALGKYAVYAIDSSADGNHGIAAFSVDVQGFNLVTNFSPKGTYDKGLNNGSSVSEGFTLLRSVNGAFSTGTDPVKGSQDTVDDQSGVVLIYGMGQVAGNLNTSSPAGSTGGTAKTQPAYSAPLLVATGTFTSGLAFNSDNTFDKANVFLTGTTTDVETAGIVTITQDLSAVPEPTTLGVIALGAGAMLGRRKRRK